MCSPEEYIMNPCGGKYLSGLADRAPNDMLLFRDAAKGTELLTLASSVTWLNATLSQLNDIQIEVGEDLVFSDEDMGFTIEA